MPWSLSMRYRFIDSSAKPRCSCHSSLQNTLPPGVNGRLPDSTSRLTSAQRTAVRLNERSIVRWQPVSGGPLGLARGVFNGCTREAAERDVVARIEAMQNSQTLASDYERQMLASLQAEQLFTPTQFARNLGLEGESWPTSTRTRNGSASTVVSVFQMSWMTKFDFSVRLRT